VSYFGLVEEVIETAPMTEEAQLERILSKRQLSRGGSRF
jgi:hypothetical protein